MNQGSYIILQAKLPRLLAGITLYRSDWLVPCSCTKLYSVTLYSICSVSWVRCTLRCTGTHTYTLCSLRSTLQSLAFFIHDYNIYWTWYRLQCCPSSQSWICSGDIVLTQERPTKSCMRIHVIMSCKHDIVCLYTKHVCVPYWSFLHSIPVMRCAQPCAKCTQPQWHHDHHRLYSHCHLSAWWKHQVLHHL